MVDITLFAEVMRIAEDAYNEGRSESEKQHLSFADIDRILAGDNLSLDGERLDLPGVKHCPENAGAVNTITPHAKTAAVSE